MATDLKSFADSAKGFTKSPLGIIALFIVLVYGFATLAVSFGNHLKDYVILLVCFLVFFPIIVFFGFLWLVSQHHDKIYGPSDFRNEDNFLKMKMSTVASLAVATVNQPDAQNSSKSVQDQLDSIVEAVHKTYSADITSRSEKQRNRILWVDDKPENNVFVRQAFESQGIEFTLALSTEEALELLASNKYMAIISDMGRNEGPKEGYVLLERLRNSGNNTPYFIYSTSNSNKYKNEARVRGAQGSTNQAQELYSMIMDTMNKI